jgi:Uma2 family endonuclease
MYDDDYEEKRLSANSNVEEPAIAYGSTVNRYSYADYLTWLDDKTREIINGIVKLMSPAATTNHARVSLKIAYEFERYIRKRKGKCQVFIAPFDVRLTKNGETEDDKIFTVVQPDICVICDLSKIDIKGCLGAPDLIVEIQSPSTAKYDLTDKFYAYEAAGVKEYWIVSPKEKTIIIFNLQENGAFNAGHTFHFKDTIHSAIFNELKIKSRDVFKDLII